MIKIECDDCGRVVEVASSIDWESQPCKVCQGSFSVVEEDNEDDEIVCNICESQKDVIRFGENYYDNEEIDLCKNCIDKKYPRSEAIIVEKVVEKPIYVSTPEVSSVLQASIINKSRFD